MRLGLIPHPDFVPSAATRIEVDLDRPDPSRLHLRYSVSGGRLLLPPPAAPARTDGLWRTTCFEVFIRPGAGPAYFEFNFAPSTQWAAYGFDDTRAGMRPADLPTPPRIAVRTTPTTFDLDVHLSLDAKDFPADIPLRLGLAAVIEDLNGARSYWALAHPAPRPDFHHPAAFTLDLPASESP